MAIQMEETKLTESFTLFFYAFSAFEGFYDQLLNDPVWISSLTRPHDPSLFPHISDFFTNGLENSQGKTKKNRAVIYELKSDSLSKEDKTRLFLYNVFFKRTHSINIGKESVEFSFIRDVPALNPKLIFVPLSGIGFLTFGIKLSGDSCFLRHLIEFNHRVVTITSGLSNQIVTQRNIHPKAHIQEEKVDQLLSEMPNTWIGEQEYTWNINSYFLYLLSGFEDKITCLSPGQLQVFTYANLADDLDPASIELSLFHLRRLYPLSYIPAHDYNLAEEEVTHHFEKVYYGVAAEGTAVIVRPDDQESLFNYSQTIINRYLWIYLLVMHQRFALLNIFPYADHAIFDFTQYKKQDLFHLTDWTSKIRQLCRYERVSHNTPTNHFYQLCRRNLGIPELLKEVDESVKELQRKLQEFNL